IGDQADTYFLRRMARQIRAQFGPVDIIIDDGAHLLGAQVASFSVLFFNLLRNGGLYLVEDMATSYVTGTRDFTREAPSKTKLLINLTDTFVHYAANLAHKLHAWNFQTVFGWNLEAELLPDKHTDAVESISFHNSIVVLRKKAQPLHHAHVSETSLCSGDLWLGRFRRNDSLHNWEEIYDQHSQYPFG
ncbi:unnamed protein product, partial [Polarella glacialis]